MIEVKFNLTTTGRNIGLVANTKHSSTLIQVTVVDENKHPLYVYNYNKPKLYKNEVLALLHLPMSDGFLSVLNYQYL